MSHVYLLPRRWIRLSCWIGHNFYSRWVLKLCLKIWILCLLCRVLFLAAFRACCCRYFHIPPLKRLSPGFFAKKNFHHMAVSLWGRFMALFEVHVFDGEGRLEEFLVKSVESASETKSNIRSDNEQRFGGFPIFNGIIYTQWYCYPCPVVSWPVYMILLPVCFGNTTCWRVADEDVASVTLDARWGMLKQKD